MSVCDMLLLPTCQLVLLHMGSHSVNWCFY